MTITATCRHHVKPDDCLYPECRELAELCPKPAPGLEIDDRGVLVRKEDKDDMQKEYDIYKKWTKTPKGLA